MSKPFKLALVADVREVLRGAKDIATALDDTASALDDLTRESQAAGQSVDRSFTTAARSADRAADKLETTFRDALDTVSDKSRTAGRDLGRHIETGSDKARRKLRDVGDEAKDTARETLASFSSLGGDLADAGQEIAANAGALFGPVGLAIGGALSAGIAIFQQKSEELKETTNKIIDELLDAGGRVTTELVTRRLQAMGDEILRSSELAKSARINIDDYNLALAGDPAATARVTDELNRRFAENAKAGAAAIQAGLFSQALADENAILQEVNRSLGAKAVASQRAAEAISRMSSATATATATATAEEQAMDRMVSAYRAAERAMSDPIVVRVDTTGAERQLARLRQQRAAMMDAREMP